MSGRFLLAVLLTTCLLILGLLGGSLFYSMGFADGVHSPPQKIYRGALLYQSNGKPTLTQCKHFDKATVEDYSDKSLKKLYMQIAEGDKISVYAELKGQWYPVFTEDGATNVDVSKLPLQLDVSDVIRLMPLHDEGQKVLQEACQNNTQQEEFTAGGNEPFWGLSISKDKGIVFEHFMATRPYAFDYAKPQMNSKQWSYQTQNTDRKMSVLFKEEACTDSMSGAYYSYSAEIRLDDDKTYRGCASQNLGR